jgi:hypothetical protein
MANKNDKLYDENGNWVEERGRVKGAIRKAFRLSPQMQEVLKKARVELPPKTLKDGSEGKKNQVRYRCAVCGELFSQKNVQIDHIEPVIKLDVPENSVDRREWAGMVFEGVFCKKDNLQVICSTPKKFLEKGQSSCHNLKSSRENYIRKEFKKLLSGENQEVFVKFVKKVDGMITYNYEQLVEYFSKQYDQELLSKQAKAIAKAEKSAKSKK